MLQIIALSATLLPEPVVPAISKCGILVKSAITGVPTKFTPRAMGSLEEESINSSLSRTSLRKTCSRFRLGISIPITDFPGIGAMMRMLGAIRASARSSAKLVILLILTPEAGSTSYIVITGPGVTSTTFASTPKSASFFSKMRELVTRLSRLTRLSLCGTSSSKAMVGS